jgi:hypothetical protein
VLIVSSTFVIGSCHLHCITTMILIYYLCDTVVVYYKDLVHYFKNAKVEKEPCLTLLFFVLVPPCSLYVHHQLSTMTMMSIALAVFDCGRPSTLFPTTCQASSDLSSPLISTLRPVQQETVVFSSRISPTHDAVPAIRKHPFFCIVCNDTQSSN